MFVKNVIAILDIYKKFTETTEITMQRILNGFSAFIIYFI